MKKFKNYSAEDKIVPEQPNQNQNHAKNNDPIPKKKLSKQNQEFINKISASGFKQFNLCEA